MEENVKKQLDQIGDLVDAKIEKAFHNAKDSANGEIESSLKSEINNLTNKYNEQFEAAQKRMDDMEVAAQKTLSGVTTKSFRETLDAELKNGALDALVKGNATAGRLELKAVGDMSMSSAYTGVIAGETIVPQFKFDAARPNHMRELIPVGSTDAQTIRFVKETGGEGGPAATAQGSTLPQIDFDLSATSVNVEKIGTFARVTAEMLADTPQLSSYLSARIPSKVLDVEDTEILNGDGSSPNLDGLFTDGTAFAAGGFATAIESANEYDVLTVAINQLNLANYRPNVIVLNPTDLHKIVLLKSTANEYLKNQIYQGLAPTINGIPVVTNTACTAGKFLVMDSQRATQLWIRDGLSVEFSREDSTNFRDGFVTVRAFERAALTNYETKAIVQGTFSTAKTALETA